MAPRKRTQAQALEDYPIIAALTLRGDTQTEIAEKISSMRDYTITQQTISNDMKSLEKIWKESAAVDIDVEKGKLKAYYEHLISEAYKAWERSQQDAVKTREGENEKGSYSYTDREPQVGDARFLAEIRALLDQYEDLFGIKAPTKSQTDLTNSDGSFLDIAPDKAVQRIGQLMQLAKDRQAKDKPKRKPSGKSRS